MKIVMAADHAGFEYKELIRSHLLELEYDAEDFGTFSLDPVDYPDWIGPAAKAVAEGQFDRGIVLGGSGNGEAMTANRYPRCTLRGLLECRDRQAIAPAQRRQHDIARPATVGSGHGPGHRQGLVGHRLRGWPAP